MAGPSSSIDVFLRLHGQRKFAKEVAASGAELEAMGLKGAKAVASFANSGEKLKRFGKSWTHNVSMPIAALGVVSGKMAMDFDRSMSLIATQAGGSAREVKGLEKAVLGMHNQFTPNERAQGLFYIESAGLRGAKAMEMLQANVKLATTGNSNLEHTVFGTVGAMNALGKEGKNFTKIAAIMNSTVGHGHMRMEELVGAISTGLVGAAKSFGVSWGGMSSAVAFFTRMGEPAQQVATRLRQTITHLATNASTKGAEALDSIGMSTEKMGQRIRKSGRIGPVIKELAEHLKAVSKTKADQVLTDAFGGGRFGTQIREATQRWQLLLRTEKEVAKFGTAKELNRANAIAEKQSAVKLKETWGDLSAVLINLGNVVLPVAVPALEKLTGVVSGAGHAFGAMSPEVQAGIGGFLLLTGPIAHGLGYFAGGVGRALILTKKLMVAGQDFGAFAWALKSGGQSMKGAASYAFRGSGIAGALQTAKGFALSLGPAVAAYGVGNIVTSALSGDWGDAGLEAGGAFVGGLAGYLGGGPLVGMLGMGAGSLAGELLSGLFGSETKVLSAQERAAQSAKRVKAALEGEHHASSALAKSGAALVSAHHRQKAASQEVRHAERALSTIRAEFGPNSEQAIRAEVHLAKAGERRFAITRKLHRQEKLHGEAQGIFKQENANAVLQERSRIKLLKGQVEESRERRRKLMSEGVTGRRLIQADEALTQRTSALRKERSALYKSWAEANKKIGPEWANFVRHANAKALELGKGLKAVREEAEGLRKTLHKLRESSSTDLGPFKRGVIEEATESALGRNRREERELRPHHHGRHAAPPRRSPRRRDLVLTTPLGSSLSAASAGGDIVIPLTAILDGDVVAQKVTRRAQKAANRQ